MNRRNAIKAAIGGIAAACGLKAAKAAAPVIGLRIGEAVTCERMVVYVEGDGVPPSRGVITKMC